MSVSRSASLALLGCVATTWAAAMVIAGLWLVGVGVNGWPGLRTLSIAGGIAAMSGGQFIFMVLVADRLFPDVGRSLMWGIEVLTFLTFLAGLSATLMVLYFGAIP